MPFAALMRDTVTVVKRGGGKKFEGIKASVQSDQISILQTEPLIEPLDIIVRKMSNGGEETFEVLDPGFHEGLGSIPAGYRMKVRKLGLPESQGIVQSIIYNVNGHNSRINNHSVDNSTNIFQDSNNEAARLLGELREAISTVALSPKDHAEAIEIIDGVQEQFATEKPKRSIVKAMLSALPNVAAIASTVDTLISLAN
jgi:hypothetical protein